MPWLMVAWCVAVLGLFGWAKEAGYDAWPFAAGLYAAAAQGGGGSGWGWGGSSGGSSGGSGGSGGRSGSSSGSHK